MCLNLVLPAFDYTGQQISNNFFVSVMNMLLIYLFSSMKLENGHKKHYLALVLKLCCTMLFYEIGLNIIRNGGLNKNLNTIHWKGMCLVDLLCLEMIFTT